VFGNTQNLGVGLKKERRDGKLLLKEKTYSGEIRALGKKEKRKKKKNKHSLERKKVKLGAGKRSKPFLKGRKRGRWK